MRALSVPLAVVLISCGTPSSDPRLADAYVSLLRFRDASARSDTVTVRAGVDSILAAYGFNRESYATAFKALGNDPDLLPSFFQRVDERIAATNPALQPTP